MRFVRQTGDTTPRDMARDQIRRLIAAGGFRRGDQLPTYADLCKRLGVSFLTVQRAMGDLARDGIVYRLHGKGCYVGKALNSGPRPFSQVGLVFGASLNMLIRAPYLNQILDGVLTACGERNVDLTILSIRTARGRIPPAQLAAQVDAVILLGLTNTEYLRGFQETHVPLVLVDNLTPGLPVDTVVVDNARGVGLVMQDLLARGHRRIAYVSGLTRDPIAEAWVEPSDETERREAYAAEMHAAGLGDHLRVFAARVGGGTGGDAAAAATGPRPVTAFVAFGALLVPSLCRELAAAGLRVPQDVSVAAAAGAPTDDVLSGLPITYAKADFAAMGVAAVEALERRCRASPPPEPAVSRVPVTFVPGGTAAARAEQR
jgi:LacI family transcriptional regulator